MHKNILISGVSSGIGLATAEALLKRGHRVFGTLWNLAHVPAQLSSFERFTAVEMDVSQEETIAAAVKVVDGLTGGWLDVLINNAGMAVSGPLIHIPDEELAMQFEVNVLGLLRLTRHAAPLLGATEPPREQPGKVINVSSISGVLTRPYMAPYSASKFAVESLSDALRMELHRFGIEVVIVQPGAVQTPIWQKAKADVPKYQDTPYARMFRAQNRLIRRFEKIAIPVERVSALMVKIVERPKNKHRYLISAYKPVVWIFARLVPTWLSDKMYLREVNFLEQST